MTIPEGERMADALMSDHDRLDAITRAIALIANALTYQSRLTHDLAEIGDRLADDRAARAYFRPRHG